MVMDYFKGIHFLSWTSQPEYTLWADRTFKDYYTLQYLKSGNITLRIDDNPESVLTGPSAWLTFPGPRFRFGNRKGELWNHNYVAFSGVRVNTFVQSGLFPIDLHPPVVKLTDDRIFDHDFMQLISILDKGNVSNDRAVLLLEGLFLQLHNVPPSQTAETSLKKDLNRIAGKITDTPEINWIFTEEAEKLNISFDYFRHQFKSIINISPGRYLMNRRLQKGAYLLRTTDHPVKKIAAIVGMDDLYYFSRQFKKLFHLPPGRYRKEFQNNPITDSGKQTF